MNVSRETMERLPQILVLGPEVPSGSYLLRIRVRQDLRLAFGRFRGGKPIAVPAGEYVYVGSALGRGATSLAHRLLRHATRTAPQGPHTIRAEMLATFPGHGLGAGTLPAPSSKRLIWNVDYLLDHAAAEIIAVLALRSPARREREIARFLEQDLCTRVIERGLGAGDAPGSTHLLRLDADAEWWDRLPDRLRHLL